MLMQSDTDEQHGQGKLVGDVFELVTHIGHAFLAAAQEVQVVDDEQPCLTGGHIVKSEPQQLFCPARAVR